MSVFNIFKEIPKTINEEDKKDLKIILQKMIDYILIKNREIKEIKLKINTLEHNNIKDIFWLPCMRYPLPSSINRNKKYRSSTQYFKILTKNSSFT